MLRRLGTFVILCAVTISVGPIARADDSLRTTLQSRYAAMKAAMEAHNEAAMTALLAPDFTSIDVMGRLETASQMIREVDELKPDPNKSSQTTLMSISSAANVLTVEQRYDMKTVKANADGTRHRIELITLSMDTWVNPAGIWLIKKTVTNELSYFVDGRLAARRLKP